MLNEALKIQKEYPMTTVTNLPSIIHSLTFLPKKNDDFKNEKPYLEERWLIDWRKNLGIIRMRFLNTNE